MADNRTAKDSMAESRPLDDKPVGRARDKTTGPARPPPPFQNPGKMDVKPEDGAHPDDRKKKREEDEKSVRKGPVE